MWRLGAGILFVVVLVMDDLHTTRSPYLEDLSNTRFFKTVNLVLVGDVRKWLCSKHILILGEDLMSDKGSSYLILLLILEITNLLCELRGVGLVQGRFEILTLTGSYTVSDNGGIKSRSGGLSVSLASPDGRVIGGGVAGLLMAASPIQVTTFPLIHAI